MSQSRGAVKPDGVEYWVDDRPPWSLSLMSIIGIVQVGFSWLFPRMRDFLQVHQ